MASTINTNMASLNAQRNLSASQNSLTTSMQRLSSGMRINSAKDDAAGLAISERMTAQVNGLNQAAKNANDGISLAQTAEGTLGIIGNNLQRIRELAVQSRNATNSSDDRAAIQKEVSQLTAEIDRVAKNTAFNGTNLLDGSFTAQSFQVGANQGQTIEIAGIADAKVSKLGSWTSVATSAKMTAGSTLKAYATSGESGTFTTTAASTAAGQQFSMTVGGVTFVNRVGTAGGTGTGSAVTAFAIDGEVYVGGVHAQLQAAGITAQGSAQTGDLAFSKSDGTNLDVTVVNTFGAAPSGGFANAGFFGSHAASPFGELASGDLVINAVNIGSVTGGASVVDGLINLVQAINDKTAQSGVKATTESGKLVLSSTTGNISLSGDWVERAGFVSGQTTVNGAGGVAYKAGVTESGFSGLDVSTADGADNAILAMDAALKAVNASRADLGAVQNRFESVVKNLDTSAENLTSARSRIQDADFAVETANLSRAQILQQAGTAMVAQANQLPQGVLTLLRG
ncbi:flagellin [Comamonadaceae bacterium PP-2]